MENIIFYGEHSADYNACEVIATYNALLLLCVSGDYKSFIVYYPSEDMETMEG